MGEVQSRAIPANEYQRVRWKNGLGWTREILRFPDADDWDWRLSIAEIEQGSAFSVFPGIDRELVLLAGKGMRLRFADHSVQELHPPHGRLRFAGELGVRCELIDGPTQDFNLMWRRDRFDAELWLRPLAGTMVLFVGAGETWAMHLVSGRAEFADGSELPALEAGDSAILEPGAERTRHVLEGHGELLLLRLQARAG